MAASIAKSFECYRNPAEQLDLGNNLSIIVMKIKRLDSWSGYD
jgi:hypothetical protein